MITLLRQSSGGVAVSDAYLILANGAVFKGKQFGYDGEAVGELVFSTGMTGYLETLSDPAYFGQIVLQTFPLVGNYGVIPQDFGTGPVHLRAYIVREWCQEPSNFRSEGNLDSFLREHKTPGLFDIDTRQLTRVIRSSGVMNAMVSKTPELTEDQWVMLRGYRITDAIAAVNAKNSEFRIPNSEFSGGRADPFRCREQELGMVSNIIVWDFGCASRMTELLAANRCAPVIVGHNATAEEISRQNPVGVVLSGGPGDPAENTRIIGEIKKLCEMNIPILAVGLGHQMLALAQGAKTEKLPFGHRGANQPVRQKETGHAFVTAQNHGYTVTPASLPENAVISYENLSDGTCEGIDYSDFPAFSIQFDLTDDIFAKFLLVVKK